MTDKLRQTDSNDNVTNLEVQRVGGNSNLMRVLREELCPIHPRYLLMQFFVSLLPHNSLNRARTILYRLAGFSIGKGALVLGRLTLTGDNSITGRLTIGEYSRINSPFYAELNADISIGRNVGIGHHVIFITTDHDTTDSNNRSGRVIHAPITIEDGASVGASVTILPGVTIGAGSVVAAGSLVTQSVPANRVIGGVPARPVKALNV
jgi:maltose O-acetyltransferase